MLMLKAILSRNFISLKMGQIVAVLGIWGQGFEKLREVYCIRHIFVYV